MKYGILFTLLIMVLLMKCKKDSPSQTADELKQQVFETELAFAKSMADRDFESFKTFLSEETVFFSGPEPLHGKTEVADWWQRYYEKPQAPFSWKPETVEVLPSGGLGLSAGPVLDQDGKLIGAFTSIWRLEADGVWRIVFDKGNDICD